MAVFYQTCSESCPDITYSVFLNTLYHEKPVGALVADFVLVLYHLADGVVVFFNGFFHGCVLFSG